MERRRKKQVVVETGLRGTIEYGNQIDDIVEDYTEHLYSKNLSRKTIKGYSFFLNRFVETMKEEETYYWEELNRKVIERYIASLIKTVSDFSAKRFLKYFKILCTFVETNYYEVYKVDFKKMIPPRVRRQQQFAYTDEDIENIFKVLNEMEEDYFSIRMKVVIILMLQTGLRSNEVCGLQVRDINFEENYIFVREAKCNKQRKVPMTKTLSRVLSEFLEVRNNTTSAEQCKYFFLDHNNEQMSYDAMRLWLNRKIKSKVKLSPNRKWGMHQFRIKFATEYYKKTKDIKKLQKILGHSDISMTLHYVKIVEDDIILEDVITVNDNFDGNVSTTFRQCAKSTSDKNPLGF